jgi:ribonucleoside-diphosphate reductase alpha chain
MRKRGALHSEETVPDAVHRTIRELLSVDAELTGRPDPVFATLVETLVGDGVLALSTAPLANTGMTDAVTASCTVLPLHTTDGEVDLVRLRAHSASALGEAIGTGYNLSAVVDPWRTLMQINDILIPIDADLMARQRRPVASMATVRADHPRIRDVLRAERATDAGWRVTLSILVDEALFGAAAARTDYPLIDESGTVVDHVDAETLLGEIASSSHRCGEPGILFWDRFEQDNPTPQWPYVSTAPCAEVAMPVGDGCHFSYVNLARLVRNLQFDEEGFVIAVRALTRLLDASVELTAANGNRLGLMLVRMKRRIGVGLTGFADLLIQLGLPYGSAEALRLARRVSEIADYQSKRESVQLARQRGPFPACGVSRYTNPAWVRRKVARSGSEFVSLAEWNQLFTDIAEHGIRHACTTALPSAETSSALVDSSTSLEPLTVLIGTDGRLRASVRTALGQPVGESPAETALAAEAAALPHLRTAVQIPYQDHLAVQAAFQSFLDDGISKTVNFPKHATVDEFRDALGLAHHLGLKGTSMFRAGCLTVGT